MSQTATLSEAVLRRETDLWDAAFRTQLDKAESAIIFVCQRLHRDDLVGHVTGAGRRLAARSDGIAS